MSKQIRSSIRRTFSNRTATMAAAAVGLLLGASGLAAAQSGDDGSGSSGTDNSVVTTSDTSVSEPTLVDLTIPTGDSGPTTEPEVTLADNSDDGTSTSLPDDDGTSTSLPDNSDDDGTSTSLPDNSDDDGTSTSLPDNSDDDGTSTSLPDDDGTSTSVPDGAGSAPPAPFTETYMSSGGSITVTWSGTALTIDSISPAAGYGAEIEDHRWDKVRVDFEGDTTDSRIEVRVDDGQVRVRID